MHNHFVLIRSNSCLLKTVLTLISTYIGIHIPIKLWDEITYLFPNLILPLVFRMDT